MSDLKFEIKKHLLTLSKDMSGWTTELNIVSFNGREPKFDLRKWSPAHDNMAKGVSFNEEQAEIIIKALKEEIEK